MIHHISIPARDPEHVARVIAELWQTVALPFPPYPDSFVVITDDGHGTDIEIAPLGIEFMPGEGDQQAQIIRKESPSPFSATHAALSVPVSEERIKEIAAREGWRAATLERGSFFQVVEFWIENRLLLELLPPNMVQRYLDFMTTRNFAERFKLDLPRDARVA
jgi:hypothetical protein